MAPVVSDFDRCYKYGMREGDESLLREVEEALSSEAGEAAALAAAARHLAADTATLHMLGDDGVLHLKAVEGHLPDQVLQKIATIEVGKGMAGLAVERAEPVTACNLQADDSGDVRPGAKATGLQGSIVVPVLRGADAVGALGVANHQERDFSAEETALLVEVARRIGATSG